MSMKNPPPLPWLVAETEDLACEAIIYALEELKEKVRRGKKELKVKRRQKKCSPLHPFVLTCRPSAPPRTASCAAVEQASGGQKSY